MTLVRCRAVRSGIGFREFEPELIVDGGHLVPDQQLLVRSLSCRYSGLEQWAADPTKFRSTAQLPFQTPKSATAELATGETISVQFSVDGPRQMDHESGKGGATLGWKLNAWLSVRAPDERPHAGMLRLLDRLADFVALCYGQPVNLLEGEGELEVVDAPSKLVPVKIIHNRRVKNPTPIPSTPSSTRLLLTLDDIRDRVEGLVRKWCAADSAIQPLYDLYFATLRSSGMYLEHRFLSLFQALESYHRRACPVPPQEREKHDQRRERILATIDDSRDRKWLKGRLKHSHEPGAKERLRGLIERYQAEWIFPEASKQTLEAMDIRNYLTHYDAGVAERLPKGQAFIEAMHNHSVRMQALCELILLNEAGVDAGLVEQRMREVRPVESRLATPNRVRP